MKGDPGLFSRSNDSIWFNAQRAESIPVAGQESKPHHIPWPRRDTDLTQLISRFPREKKDLPRSRNLLFFLLSSIF